MSKSDPSKPTPNSEKFKPENVQDPLHTEQNSPANGDGPDLPRGSESKVGRKSRNRG